MGKVIVAVITSPPAARYLVEDQAVGEEVPEGLFVELRAALPSATACMSVITPAETWTVILPVPVTLPTEAVPVLRPTGLEVSTSRSPTVVGRHCVAREVLHSRRDCGRIIVRISDRPAGTNVAVLPATLTVPATASSNLFWVK